MQSNSPESTSPTSSLKRTLMLAATLSLAAVGWVLLDEPDAVGAAESRTQNTVAVVDGMVLTEDEVLHQARHELDELDAQRAEILERAVETKVCDLMIEAEARSRGIDRHTLLAEEIDAKLDTVATEGAELDAAGLYELRWQEFMAELRRRHHVEVVTPGL